MSRIPQEIRARLGTMPVYLTFLAILALLAGAGQAAGLEERHGSANRSSFGLGLVIADLDGDAHPDVATVSVAQSSQQSTDYFIQFRFSNAADAMFGLSARAGGLDLAPRDVNGDAILDVVVRTALDSRVVAVLVNDGHGRFSLLEPAPFSSVPEIPENFLQTPVDPTRDMTAMATTRSSFGQKPDASFTLYAPRTECTVVALGDADVVTGQAFLCFARSPPTSIHTA